jgi:chromosome segregation ATPase
MDHFKELKGEKLQAEAVVSNLETQLVKLNDQNARLKEKLKKLKESLKFAEDARDEAKKNFGLGKADRSEKEKALEAVQKIDIELGKARDDIEDNEAAIGELTEAKERALKEVADVVKEILYKKFIKECDEAKKSAGPPLRKAYAASIMVHGDQAGDFVSFISSLLKDEGPQGLNTRSEQAAYFKETMKTGSALREI